MYLHFFWPHHNAPLDSDGRGERSHSGVRNPHPVNEAVFFFPSTLLGFFCPPLAAVITAHQREQLATQHNLSADVCVWGAMQFIHDPLSPLSYLLLASWEWGGVTERNF